MPPPPEIVTEPRPIGDAPDPERAARKARRRRFRRIIGVVILIGLAWTAWAAGSFYQLRDGLQNADPVALERRIDWRSVVQGLREDLQADATSPEGDATDSNDDAAPAGASHDSSTIDALLSRQAVINLLRSAKLDDRGWKTARPIGRERRQERVFGWEKIRYAFFSGGPFEFRVDVSPDSDKMRRPLILLFTWHGDWRLTRVFLPSDAEMKVAAQTPSPRAVSSISPQPVAHEGQRAALFEENLSDPQGKSYTGSVAWRTEETPSSVGGVSEVAVTAQVVIPERPLKMTMTIRRNLDKSLPSSHVIEVRFDLPSNGPTGSVKDVLGVLMKPSEEIAGEQLVGNHVKVSSDNFLIGLSASEADMKRNLQALKDNPWFGIPFVYSNGSRAVLAIEKGAAGEKSITEALARWSTTSISQSAPAKQ